MKNYKQILEAVNKGIQLALDDFDDEEQVQNIKSKQVQNRDYTKEYLDLIQDTVDFNLPSGNLWYKFNLGAVNPTESAASPLDWYGDYYAWGETMPKVDYTEEKYKFIRLIYLNNTTKVKYTKYCHNIQDGYKGYIDNLTQLESEDDVAHIKLGKKYYIPTVKDFEELFKYTTHTYIRDYCRVIDLNGVLFTSIDDNSKTMFIPCAGLRCANTTWNPNGESCVGFEVHLWTSTFGKFITGRASSIEGKQHEFDAGWGKCKITNDDHRFFGLPIRPVYRKN